MVFSMFLCSCFGVAGCLVFLFKEIKQLKDLNGFRRIKKTTNSKRSFFVFSLNYLKIIFFILKQA